eukprot:SAG25_NODE_4690_length_767_cov_0.920659_1_plen_53_part_10
MSQAGETGTSLFEGDDAAAGTVKAVKKVVATRRALREARLEEARAVQEFERFE